MNMNKKQLTALFSLLCLIPLSGCADPLYPESASNYAAASIESFLSFFQKDGKYNGQGIYYLNKHVQETPEYSSDESGSIYEAIKLASYSETKEYISDGPSNGPVTYTSTAVSGDPSFVLYQDLKTVLIEYGPKYVRGSRYYLIDETSGQAIVKAAEEEAVKSSQSSSSSQA
jgi:hypothetical protein